MQDEKSSKEAPFIMNTKWIAKEKIIASPEEHGELEWILLANSTRLSMDTRRYPSGISPFGSMLHQKSFGRRGICSLTTSWTRFQLHHFSLVPRELSCTFGLTDFGFFFLLTILFQKGLFWPIFPPFGIALLRLWDRFTWNQYKQHYLLSSQASLRFET